MKKIWKKPVIEKVAVKKITLSGSGQASENRIFTGTDRKV